MVKCIRVNDRIDYIELGHGDEVWGLSDDELHFLPDHAIELLFDALDKQSPKNVVSEGNDESDWVSCPRCNEILGVNESVYDAFCDNNWHPVYCHKCGQALVWKQRGEVTI